MQSEIRALPGNTVCADCNTKGPQWASISFGSMFCLECSGVHRSLGVHISFVRSITMDSWSDKQLTMMRLGGNNKLIAWLDEHGIPKTTAIKQKYESPEAELYKLRLKAVAEGTTPPTVLPKREPRKPYVSPQSATSPSGSGSGGGGAGGFGNPQYQSFGSTQNPGRGGGGGGAGGGMFDRDSMQATGGAALESLSSAWGAFGTAAASVTQSAAERMKEARLGEKLHEVTSDGKLVDSIKDTTTNSWNLLSSSATSLWQKATTGGAEEAVPSSSGGGATARAQEIARLIQEQTRREEESGGGGGGGTSGGTSGGASGTSAIDGFGAEEEYAEQDEEDDDEWLRNQLSGGASSVAAAASSSANAVQGFAAEGANAMMGGLSLGANAATNAMASVGLSQSTSAPTPNPVAPVAASGNSDAADAAAKKANEEDFFASFGVN